MRAPNRVAAFAGSQEQIAASRTLTFTGYDASTREELYSDLGYDWDWAAYQRELAPANADMMDPAGRDAQVMNFHQWRAR